MADHPLQPGLYEALLTGVLDKRLADLVVAAVTPELRSLADAEAADRLSRHLAMVVTRAIEALPEHGRAQAGARIVSRLIDLLSHVSDAIDREIDLPLEPARVLSAILRRKPDGSAEALDAPLTPLLDTTLLTNSRGEPAVGHELRAEIHSSDAIDVVMAFVRWSGIRPLLEALRRHCRDGKSLRVVTTTYTNSTELRALDELVGLGAQIKVSYDTASTRLHAKAWLFHRQSGYSTAYIGSSNLTHSAMVTGLEWNVRVSGVRNPDVVAKMTAVFDSYWASGDFIPFDRDQFLDRTALTEPEQTLRLSPIEIVLMPFQDRLLEQVELARTLGRHRNLLVAATGTGKTVIAAVDYARLRERLPRDRLLFVAHREEILEETGLELEDVYANNRSWSALRRAVGLPTDDPGPEEDSLLRAVGRLLHVDDRERLDAYRSLVARASAPDPAGLSDRERRFARMLIGSLTTLKTSASLTEGLAQLWEHPQVRKELLELLDLLPERVDHLHAGLSCANVPLAVHARYTRTEILAAFDVGRGVSQAPAVGRLWDENSQTDLFAFTLDKSAGSFSPTTRYRDYAISPELIHWESRFVTSLDSDTGRLHQSGRTGTNVVLFARLSTADRAFWCSDRRHTSRTNANGDQDHLASYHRLSGDLFADFAAAVA